MKTTSTQKGFSFIDIMIGLTILLIGVLTLGAALTTAIVRTTENSDQLRAKAIASSTIENIFAARYMAIDDETYGFGAIQHVGNGEGVFLTGRQPIYETPGVDGLYGTGDDASGGGAEIPGFEREILIEDVNNPLRPTPPNPITERRITINIYYTVRGRERTQTLVSGVGRY